MSDDVKRVETGVHDIAGLKPEVWGATNFSPAAEGTMRFLANYLNQILAKRLKTHFAVWTPQTNILNPDTPLRVLLFTSPNAMSSRDTYANPFSRVRCRMVLTAGRDDAATMPNPRVTIRPRSITGGRDDMTLVTIHNTHRDTDEGPQNFREVEVDIDLGGILSETYELEISTLDLCQIVSLTFFEVPRSSLDAGLSALFVATDGFHVPGPIYDRDLAQLWQMIQLTYDCQGSVFIAWSAQSSTDAAAITDVAYTNLWSLATAWDADAFGFWTWPEFHGTLANGTFGVVIWAILDLGNAGGSSWIGSLSFVTSAGEIGHFDFQDYPPGLPGPDPYLVPVAFQTTWSVGDPSFEETLKVDILGKYSGASLAYVYACGMYAKDPLDPRSIPNLALWLAADRLPVVADGTAIATWPDSSGLGNDADQPLGFSQPLYKTNVIQGKPVLRFDGVDDYFTIADSASYKSTEPRVFIVARQDPAALSTGTIAGYPHAAASSGWRWGVSINPAGGTAGALEVQRNNGTIDTNIYEYSGATLWRVWSFDIRNFSAYRDGRQMLTGTGADITYPNAVGLFIGANGAFSVPWLGDIAEILIYTDLRAGEFNRISEYLHEKYGLQTGPL